MGRPRQPKKRGAVRSKRGRSARPSPPRRSRRRRNGWRQRLSSRWSLLLSAAIGVAAALILTSAAALRCFSQRPGPALDAPVVVGWPEGLDAAEAAGLLADLGLTSRRRTLELYLRSTDASSCFRAGPHLLPRQAPPALLRQLLCRTSDRPVVRVVIPEGFTRFAIASRLQQLGVCAERAFLHVSADTVLLHALGVEAVDAAGGDTAEGYLFPATYELPLDSDPPVVLRRLVSETERRWRRLVAAHPGVLAELEQELEWGRHEVLTLASMVEREAGAAEERPVIASVFFNRLRDPSFRPKLLQSDPTAAYGCLAMPADIPSCATFAGVPTPAINADPANRYSTYAHEGLPPGPIANPGELAIEAVLAPADTTYLYFVATGDGAHHTFSSDYRSHREAVDRLRARRAR
ncbi:MAG: endolytic transglycosylase MltG [Deltaproteobacteria bacterium]|nr:endolytic transglycosylase MltG [Deltaproteobacteria bacterium]MBW2532594.1 endolytic transglycosylase MltG [Deltaproteobacteria bacterium]